MSKTADFANMEFFQTKVQYLKQYFWAVLFTSGSTDAEFSQNLLSADPIHWAFSVCPTSHLQIFYL